MSLPWWARRTTFAPLSESSLMVGTQAVMRLMLFKVPFSRSTGWLTSTRQRTVFPSTWASSRVLMPKRIKFPPAAAVRRPWLTSSYFRSVPAGAGRSFTPPYRGGNVSKLHANVQPPQNVNRIFIIRLFFGRGGQGLSPKESAAPDGRREAVPPPAERPSPQPGGPPFYLNLPIRRYLLVSAVPVSRVVCISMAARMASIVSGMVTLSWGMLMAYMTSSPLSTMLSSHRPISYMSPRRLPRSRAYLNRLALPMNPSSMVTVRMRGWARKASRACSLVIFLPSLPEARTVMMCPWVTGVCTRMPVASTWGMMVIRSTAWWLGALSIWRALVRPRW